MKGLRCLMLVSLLVLLLPHAAAVDVIIDGDQETITDSVDADVEKNIVFIATEGGENATYKWDFGDGKTGTGEIVTHRYTSGGTYRVTLVWSDANGTDSTVIEVAVSGPTELQAMSLIAIGLMMAIAGIASAMGLAIAGTSAMALSAEKEVGLGRILMLSALPFTQVIYAFAIAFFILMGVGLIGGAGVPPDVAMNSGSWVALFGIALIVGITGVSAIPQGISAGASLSAIGKRDKAFSGGLIISAMPEAVAMFGFVLGLLAIIGLGLF